MPSLPRLDAIRRPDTFDDTLTPTQVEALETAATTMAEFHEGYLSAIRRILHGGDPGNWFDDVPISLATLASRATVESIVTDGGAVVVDGGNVVTDGI